MNFNITAYSTALFSTWIFIEELGLLFDAGDGLSAGLLQKARKIKHAFISHPDRDHITGLLQFHQLNAHDGNLKIYYPKDSGSFPALQSFMEKFDPHVSGATWIPIQEQMEFKVKGNYRVSAIKNGHIPTKAGITKSLSYQVFTSKRKIKDAFLGVSGNEIARLAKEKGNDFITREMREKVLAYSGDTPIEDLARWDNTKTLIHEATFLNDDPALSKFSGKHSNLEDVLEMVANINIEQLVLSHFSTRYAAEDIDAAIKKASKKYGIKIPIYRILPGQVHQDVLSEPLING